MSTNIEQRIVQFYKGYPVTLFLERSITLPKNEEAEDFVQKALDLSMSLPIQLLPNVKVPFDMLQKYERVARIRFASQALQVADDGIRITYPYLYNESPSIPSFRRIPKESIFEHLRSSYELSVRRFSKQEGRNLEIATPWTELACLGLLRTIKHPLPYLDQWDFDPDAAIKQVSQHPISLTLFERYPEVFDPRTQ